MASLDELIKKARDANGYILNNYDNMASSEENRSQKNNPNFKWRDSTAKFECILMQSLFEYACTSKGISANEVKFIREVTINYDLLDTTSRLSSSSGKSPVHWENFPYDPADIVMEVALIHKVVVRRYFDEVVTVFSSYENRLGTDYLRGLKWARQAMFESLAQVEGARSSKDNGKVYAIDELISEIEKRIKR